jgi:small-conductance mechanosensitive channel
VSSPRLWDNHDIEVACFIGRSKRAAAPMRELPDLHSGRCAVKLFEQAWAANDPYHWIVAGAIALAVLIAFAVAKLVLRRVLTLLSARSPEGLSALALNVLEGSRVWVLTPLALYAGASALELPRKLEAALEVLAIIAFVVQAAIWVNRFVQSWMNRQIAQHRTADGETVTALSLIGFSLRVLTWALALLFALDQLGFDITALVTGLGIGGVAVALAVQNILGDLLASLSIVLDKPFVVGDFIVAGDDLGTVEHIGIKTTRVRALSGELIVFPNGDLLKSRIHNFKRMYQRRVPFTIDVVYETSPEKLELIPGLVRHAVELQEKTRFDRAHLKACGAHSYVFEAVYFVLDPDFNVYMDIHQAVNLEIIRAFAREEIEFAYPTQTLLLTQPPRPADGSPAPQRASSGMGAERAG